MTRGSSPSSLLDRLTIGIVLLDRRGCVLSINNSARDMLDARDGLVLGADRISARDRRQDEQLQALIITATLDPPEIGFRGVAIISRRGRATPLSVIATSIDAAIGGSPEGAVAVLCIDDPERRSELPAQIVIGLYGLTNDEADLAVALMSGETLAEAAGSIGLRFDAAHRALMSIFAKTNTCSPAELVALVLRQAGWSRPH